MRMHKQRFDVSLATGLLTLALLLGTGTASGQDAPIFDVSETEGRSTSDDVTSRVEDDSGSAPSIFSEIVDVRVINVEVFVTNKAGVPVAGLGIDDFELEVDGKKMEISNLYAEAGGIGRETLGDLPPSDPSFRSLDEVQAAPARRSHVVILIDHNRLRASNRASAFKAVRAAIEKLDANDLVSVVGIENNLVFYSDLLFDRQAVNRILDDVSRISRRTDIGEAERRLIFGELARGMSGGILAQSSLAEAEPLLSRIRAYAAEEFQRGITSLKQMETVVSTLGGIEGKKVLLYVGEGIPTRPGEGLYTEFINRFGSGNSDAELGLRRFDFSTDYTRSVGRYDLIEPMKQLARAANRAGVTLYAIDAEGSHSSYIRSALTEQGAVSETLSVIDENYRVPLEAAARATGGRLLQAHGELTTQLAQIINDLDTFYSLGFAAPDDWDRGTDHSIKIGVKGKGFRVRHRDDVRLPSADEREAGGTLAALMYQTVDNTLGFSAVAGSPAHRQDGTAAVAIELAIPIERLSFLPQGEAQAASINIYVSTKDAEGNPSRVQKVAFHLPPIPNDVMDKLTGEAARYPLPVVLRPGDQQVAIGVRDNVTGSFSALRLDVSRLSPSS